MAQISRALRLRQVVFFLVKKHQSDEDTRDSEALVVADDTHDPSETPVVLETAVVDDDYFHVNKKPCLDDRDTNLPLDKDRDTMPGPEERSSRPGQ